METQMTLIVEARVRDTGEIKTTRKVVGGDSLPSGGLVQAGHALFVETLRSESYLMLLSKLSLGGNLESISPKELETLVFNHLVENIQRFLPEVSMETLRRVGWKPPKE